jgi:hypothetical protein
VLHRPLTRAPARGWRGAHPPNSSDCVGPFGSLGEPRTRRHSCRLSFLNWNRSNRGRQRIAQLLGRRPPPPLLLLLCCCSLAPLPLHRHWPAGLTPPSVGRIGSLVRSIESTQSQSGTSGGHDHRCRRPRTNARVLLGHMQNHNRRDDSALPRHPSCLPLVVRKSAAAKQPSGDTRFLRRLDLKWHWTITASHSNRAYWFQSDHSSSHTHPYGTHHHHTRLLHTGAAPSRRVVITSRHHDPSGEWSSMCPPTAASWRIIARLA